MYVYSSSGKGYYIVARREGTGRSDRDGKAAQRDDGQRERGGASAEIEVEVRWRRRKQRPEGRVGGWLGGGGSGRVPSPPPPLRRTVVV